MENTLLDTEVIFIIGKDGSEDGPQANVEAPMQRKTKLLQEYIMPKDKVSSKLFNGEITEGEVEVITGKANSAKELSAIVQVFFEDIANIKLSKQLDYFDYAVFGTVVSLYQEGIEYFTPLTVYRIITGNKKAKLTEKMKKEIETRIDKMRRTFVKIDVTKEQQGYKFEKVIFEGYLINAQKIKAIHKGKTGEWYQILQKPVLYEYAEAKKQIARLDLKLLNTPVSKTKETIKLQMYLQRRILDMKSQPFLNRDILLDKVYEECGISVYSGGFLRKKRKEIRDIIYKILTYWQQEGFIKGFKVNNKGKKAYSITIMT